MKYLPVFLVALLAIAGCSRNDPVITFENFPDEVTGAAEDIPDDEAKDVASASAEQFDNSSDIEGADQENVELVVNNQTTAGQIVIKTVATARDGWVSVHKSREDGSIRLPESIGEARVDAGESEGVIVDLWEAPYVGEQLWVLLHVDAGERGTYEFPEKDVAVSKNDEMIARSFKIKGEEKDKEETE